MPAAILGSEVLDVHDIDVTSLTLEGIAPIRVAVEDVASPASNGNSCACSEEGADGFDDLTLKFDSQELATVLGAVARGDVISLTITGEFLDGTPFVGDDCIVIRN